MGDIVKGVLGGAWTLIVGWILPCAVVLSVFGVLGVWCFSHVRMPRRCQ